MSINAVAPLAGAWIEIISQLEMMQKIAVAPLAGAWIEISSPAACKSLSLVAPLAGAWIEILLCTKSMGSHWSLPSREHGLKL